MTDESEAGQSFQREASLKGSGVRAHERMIVTLLERAALTRNASVKDNLLEGFLSNQDFDGAPVSRRQTRAPLLLFPDDIRIRLYLGTNSRRAIRAKKP